MLLILLVLGSLAINLFVLVALAIAEPLSVLVTLALLALILTVSAKAHPPAKK